MANLETISPTNYHLANIYIYKQYLALNTPQELICYKTHTY